MSWLRKLIAVPLTAEARVRFVLDEVSLGHVSLQICRSPRGISHPMLHTHHRRYLILVIDSVIK